MSQLTTRTEREFSLTDWLQSEKFRSELQLAAPRDVQAGRFARIALTLAKTNPKLMECEARSVLNAVMLCAQTGLEPGPLGHAAIIPRGGKAVWQPMYRGMLHLMHRSQQIASVQCGVVREKDHFEYDEGSDPHVKWQRALVPEADRGDRVCAFACIIPRDGKPYVRVMHWEDVMAHRDRYVPARMRESGPWVNEIEQMAMKTVLKSVGKLAPISIETQVAISYDDLGEIGKGQPDVLPPDFDADRTPDSYCNKPMSDDGLICSRDVGHAGECE